MNEVVEYEKNYQKFKIEMDHELSQAAESFVRIGYLLKVARDTAVLEQSPYSTVIEFAAGEYGLDKSQVSRFIRINDRFSEGGYSDRLEDQYRMYGYAKLSLMLQLPDEINEELSPEFSKAEIQTIKEELDEERTVSDIEVILEGEPEKHPSLPDNNLGKAIYQLGQDVPELYVDIHKAASQYSVLDADIMKLKMTHGGEKIYSIRVQGIGRLMLSVKDEEKLVHIINARSGEKQAYTWEAVLECWRAIIDNSQKDPEKNWEEVYGQEFPKVAPVQPKRPVKESKVQKAPQKKTEKKESEAPVQTKEKEELQEAVHKPEAQTETVEEKKQEQPEHAEEPTTTVNTKAEPDSEPENTEDEQLPGQMEITEYPEVLPEETLKEEIEAEEKLQTRKEYLDNCTEYGAAVYFQRWFTGNPDAVAILSDVDAMERWMKTKVDINGRTEEE